MNISRTDIQHERDVATVDVWENEGGAPGRELTGQQYGRRIEADSSWTVYHVFTGIPARVGGKAMIGLSRSDATKGMTSLNLRYLRHHKVSVKPPVPYQNSSLAEKACQS